MINTFQSLFLKGYITEDTIKIASLEFIMLAIILYCIIDNHSKNNLSKRKLKLYSVPVMFIIIDFFIILFSGNLIGENYFFVLGSAYFVSTAVGVCTLFIHQLKKGANIFEELVDFPVWLIILACVCLLVFYRYYFVFVSIDYYWQVIKALFS